MEQVFFWGGLRGRPGRLCGAPCRLAPRDLHWAVGETPWEVETWVLLFFFFRGMCQPTTLSVWVGLRYGCLFRAFSASVLVTWRLLIWTHPPPTDRLQSESPQWSMSDLGDGNAKHKRTEGYPFRDHSAPGRPNPHPIQEHQRVNESYQSGALLLSNGGERFRPSTLNP